jgi:integrase
LVEWSKTKHLGVRFWKSQTRKHRGRPEKCFVIRYKRHLKGITETVGWESAGINAQYCSSLRMKILSNIKLGQGFQSLNEKRQQEETKKAAKKCFDVTLKQTFDEFLNIRNLKERTIKDYNRSMSVAFDDWKNHPVVDITRHMVGKRHESLGKDQGAAQANQHMRFLRALLNFAAGFYEDSEGGPLLKHNPVQRISQTRAWYPVERKQTIIKPHQLPIWFKAVTELENETARDYLLLLLFTGLRKQEALKIKISQIDLEGRSYEVIDPKNKQPLTLPISNYLLKVIVKRVKKLKKHKYLFPGANKKKQLDNPNTHLKEPKRGIATVIEQSKVKFTLHDIRRHFATIAESLDFSGYAIKRLINHSVGGDVTGGYIVSDLERLRGPIQKIEDKILSLAKVKEQGKVVPIKKAK